MFDEIKFKHNHEKLFNITIQLFSCRTLKLEYATVVKKEKESIFRVSIYCCASWRDITQLLPLATRLTCAAREVAPSTTIGSLKYENTLLTLV